MAALVAARGWRVSSPEHGAAAAHDQSQLVFVGNWQDPCPRRLLFDPGLEPVDVVTWLVVRVQADASRMVAFPSYVDLMRMIRVSRATVARALAVLRLTGWLPLCAALRDANGRFAGHLYALNDEPLPLSEMIAIDGGYVGFVEHARAHRSAHVRALAHTLFQQIQDAARDSERSALEPVAVRDQVARRLEQMLILVADRVQNLNAVRRVQNLNSDRSSSNSEETTTTDRDRARANRSGEATGEQQPSGLIFPEVLSLTDSQRRVLALRLEPLPGNVRQDVLDEAAGRILAKLKTRDPVRCEFDYVARLCARSLDGQFLLTDAGERVRRNREARGKAEQRLERARKESEARRLVEIARYRARTE
jgi:hypothetical protein